MGYLPDAMISDLCLKLATLLHAGFGIGQSAQLMKPRGPGSAAVIDALMAGADRGDRLCDILGSTGLFPPYVTGLLEAGDQSGRTEEALEALSDYYNRQDMRARQIKSALLYPAMLLLMMLCVVAILLVKVLPVFDSVYASLGGSMTGIAGGLLSIGQWMDASMPVLLALLVAVVVLVVLFACSPGFRGWLGDRYKKRFGDRGVSRKLNNAKLSQALSMGLQSGMPLEDAMSVAAGLVADVPAAAGRCRTCAEKIRSDEPLAYALGTSNILSESDCELLYLGQKGGNADEAMREIARRLSVEADAALDGLVAKVEPAMVILTSLLVGMILLSVMMPLLDIMAVLG